MYVLYLISILVTLEFFLSFIYQIQFNNGQIVKETIKLGWGMWNNIGGILAFLLPVHFYFATTIKKVGPVFYFSGIVSFIAIILTLSRSSLICACFTIVICVIISCFTGKNKLINMVITIVIAISSVLVTLILLKNFSLVLADYFERGLDDNGRFKMYWHGLQNFLNNPICGGGFYSSYATEYTFIEFLPYRYHNTFIQMIATTGILGLSAYVFHRYQTLRLVLSKKHISTVFIALSIGTMLCGSLLDNHFFNIYPAFIYSIMLMVLENAIY